MKIRFQHARVLTTVVKADFGLEIGLQGEAPVLSEVEGAVGDVVALQEADQTGHGQVAGVVTRHRLVGVPVEQQQSLPPAEPARGDSSDANEDHSRVNQLEVIAQNTQKENYFQ